MSRRAPTLVELTAADGNTLRDRPVSIRSEITREPADSPPSGWCTVRM